jgi:hypothetical protein
MLRQGVGMKRSDLSLIVAPVLLALAGQAIAAEPKQARIPFADTIREWQTDSISSLYLRGDGKQWYRAETMGPCFGLDVALAVGFDTGGGTAGFDRYSSLIVQGHRCPLKSLVESGPPPTKKEKAAARAARDAGRR